jgi:hypothetical protein
MGFSEEKSWTPSAKWTSGIPKSAIFPEKFATVRLSIWRAEGGGGLKKVLTSMRFWRFGNPCQENSTHLSRERK